MADLAHDTQSRTPGLAAYLKSLRHHPAQQSADHLIALLKRHQIKHSRPCANATVHLFLRVVEESKAKSVGELLTQVRELGARLSIAQPKEYAVGNIVRRVLGLVREAVESTDNSDPNGSQSINGSSMKSAGAPKTSSGTNPEPHINGDHAIHGGSLSMREIKEDVLNGLREMLDEVDQADEQIASYALEHIIPQEIILTYTSSLTAQRFLLQAAKRRKFTVILVEGYPNEHVGTYDTIINGRKENDRDETPQGDRMKPLIASGINVILVPDSAVFAVMSKVTKVIVPAHAVFRNGGVSAAAGSTIIAQAAKAHRVPVVVLSAVYKLSPVNPVDESRVQELGDPSNVSRWTDCESREKVTVVNPVLDYIAPELVDLVVTNIGGHAPSQMYRVASDHYREEDRTIQND